MAHGGGGLVDTSGMLQQYTHLGSTNTVQKVVLRIGLASKVADHVCESHDLSVEAEMPNVTAHKMFDDLPHWDDDAT